MSVEQVKQDSFGNSVRTKRRVIIKSMGYVGQNCLYPCPNEYSSLLVLHHAYCFMRYCLISLIPLQHGITFLGQHNLVQDSSKNIGSLSSYGVHRIYSSLAELLYLFPPSEYRIEFLFLGLRRGRSSL